ncbi:MAG: zinc transporter ZupT [Lentisphaeria bacterium]|nr:zinc transporter ZupT [Lentisphaeria bacterium]
MMNPVLRAFALATAAGLATGGGSCIAFFFDRSDKRFLAFALGFSGGVMLYISFMELLAGARLKLIEIDGIRGSFCAAAAFFIGIFISMLIDRLIPEAGNPHEVRTVEEMEHPRHRDAMFRSGLLFALAIAIHNFPEGMAVFMTSISAPETGFFTAAAIAIHNIPEGITVSVPIYHATGSRKKAFFWSFLSGLAEPLGALCAYLVLMPFLSETLLMLMYAGVAGVMVYITFDELLPLAREYGEHHLSIYGLIAGMLLMAVFLL